MNSDFEYILLYALVTVAVIFFLAVSCAIFKLIVFSDPVLNSSYCTCSCCCYEVNADE